MAHHEEHIHNTNGAGYEVEDASVREIVLSAIGLAVGTIIICGAVWGLFQVLKSAEVRSREPVTDVSVQEAFPPGPRLQEKPWEELQQLRAKEEQALTTYGWVNKNAGSVRIPIDRAIEKVAERGFPTRASGQTAVGTQGVASGVAR